MRIRNITLQGFRGFNEVRTIDFHEKLTLIYAPNSYGKTSITEAMEWLLYGETSKVEKADSKQEYSGSYRNIHLPDTENPLVKMVFYDNGNEQEFKAILNKDGSVSRYIDNKSVDKWLLPQELSKIPKPFILQHALKYLLLVKPDERFKGFAHLLGLERLDRFQTDVVSLCTKPEVSIPQEINETMKKNNGLAVRLSHQDSLANLAKAYEKGGDNLPEIYRIVDRECRSRLPEGLAEKPLLPEIKKVRDDRISKLFDGHVTIDNFTDEENKLNEGDKEFFLQFATKEFIKSYTNLVALGIAQELIERLEFYNLGKKILNKTPTECPFCGCVLDASLEKHIKDTHTNLMDKEKNYKELKKQREEIKDLVSDFKHKVESFYLRHKNKYGGILDIGQSMKKLEKILALKKKECFEIIKEANSNFENIAKALDESYAAVIKSILAVESSIVDSKEDTNLLKELNEHIMKFLAATKKCNSIIQNYQKKLYDAEQILRKELDMLAGTEDLSILIGILEEKHDIQKCFKIRKILADLKELRKCVDQFIAQKVCQEIAGGLTADVMSWYKHIKTSGDPDVHFSGFDIERTKKGDLKARRVNIKAKSYDKELISAVSSLSESKLNALGLCVSIATNLKGDSVLSFLIIDDPIQSWDADHEVKFIDIIENLVEKGKQILLLSHNKQWIDQVRDRCRSMNGWYYEITSYAKAGPQIHELPWAKWQQRLQEVDAITKDTTASSSKLQRAEGEIRIAIEDIISELWQQEKGYHKSCHKLGSQDVRKMLLECGITGSLVDRITSTYTNTDPAHHSQKGYSPNKERIISYHSWVHELSKALST